MNRDAPEPLSTVARWLNLRPGESGKVLHFAALGLLLQLGLGLGFAAGDALFLSNAGAAGLPIIFVLTPAVMLIQTPLFAWATSRLGSQRACELIIAKLVLGGLLLFVCFQVLTIRSPVIVYGLKLYLAALYILMYSAYWILVDEYFSVDDGKRLYPLFSIGCSIGTAFGALTVGLLAGLLPIGAFFLMWAAIAVATLPLLIALPRLWTRIVDHNERISDDEPAQRFVTQQRTSLFPWSSRKSHFACAPCCSSRFS